MLTSRIKFIDAVTVATWKLITDNKRFEVSNQVIWNIYGFAYTDAVHCMTISLKRGGVSEDSTSAVVLRQQYDCNDTIKIYNQIKQL